MLQAQGITFLFKAERNSSVCEILFVLIHTHMGVVMKQRYFVHTYVVGLCICIYMLADRDTTHTHKQWRNLGKVRERD